MFRHVSRLHLAAALLSAALSIPATSAAAAGPCPDPRGNAYCTNNGLVNVQNPNPPMNVPGAQNPNPPVIVPGAQNPNAPIATSAPQLTALNTTGVPGGGIVVTGQGFWHTDNLYLNVIDAAGTHFDTDSRAFSCNETDNWVVSIYQDFGLGCSSGAAPGRLNRSSADGTFSGVIQIPPMALPGRAQLCANSNVSTACTPITITSN